MGVTLVSNQLEKGPASLRHCVILFGSTAVIVTPGVETKIKNRSKMTIVTPLSVCRNYTKR
jgi:hypothetical protein